MSDPSTLSASNLALTGYLLLLLSGLASAQSSDEKCTVTANGQTTQVRSDGSYLIQNIPVGNGLIRVESTYIRDGITLYGATEFAPLSSGQTVEFGPVPLSPEPLPTVVSVRATSPGTIDEIGETGQVLVEALLSDQTTEDVTPQSAGSAYASSNPAIASVDVDGLVTATGRGTAAITVTNQGATATVRVAVSPGDPGTAVEGIVLLEDGTPVAGAEVTLLGLPYSAISEPGGRFCIRCEDLDVPTLLGSFDILARATVQGTELTGFARDVLPLPAKITDAGVIELSPCLEAPLPNAWWKLDETSGNTAADSAGDHDGTYGGDPGPAPGLVDGALDFDGNDYVRVPDDDLWHLGTSDFTIEFWAQFDTNGGGSIGRPGDVFLGNDEGGGSRRKWFFALGGGQLNFHVNGSFSRFFPLVPFTPEIGRWYHLAITREADLFTIYVDGIARGSATESRSIPDANTPLTLGWAEGFGFDGRIDEMSFYRLALPPEVLEAIYLAGAVGKCVE